MQEIIDEWLKVSLYSEQVEILGRYWEITEKENANESEVRLEPRSQRREVISLTNGPLKLLPIALCDINDTL